ncbi:hypothetical protein FPSM_01679 [Flavobacterium psychrophilum]|nr:hypothetical protein FPSM_01679 [Flavobacterium psychrophilum]
MLLQCLAQNAVNSIKPDFVITNKTKQERQHKKKSREIGT